MFAPNLLYVDIAAAYYSIYSRLPFDIRFQGLRVYGGELLFRDFLPFDLKNYKLCRNVLVGILRSLESTRVLGGKLVKKPNRNPLLSPEHWGYIVHLLHFLAKQAIECGAIYYNTDGAIFQRDDDAIKWMALVQQLGLTPRLDAQGPGYVAAVGRYQVGTKRGGAVNGRLLPFDNLIEPSPYVEQRWIQWL